MTAADYPFVVQNLVVKDFKIRYRNMSLGVFWSLLNPFIMMGVLVFVFTNVFPDQTVKGFPLFILCGLIPFNFFTLAWSSGMVCVADNSGFVKRIPLPRALLPISNVLANCIHMLIQSRLLLTFTLALGYPITRYWLFLPVVWALEVIFIMGLVLATCAIDVYVRDLRYIVDSIIRVLFWAVPIFYSIERVPARFRGMYEYNPISALTISLRQILMDATAPEGRLLWKLSLSAVLMFTLGWVLFQRLQRRFYERL